VHPRFDKIESGHPKMASIYILQCVDNSYYIGSCNDIGARFNNHLNGKCKYTKSRLPVKIVYTEYFGSLSDARKRERQIKGWKSRKMIEKLIKSDTMAPSSNGSGH
jgi:putative endonuclease